MRKEVEGTPHFTAQESGSHQENSRYSYPVLGRENQAWRCLQLPWLGLFLPDSTLPCLMQFENTALKARQREPNNMLLGIGEVDTILQSLCSPLPMRNGWQQVCEVRLMLACVKMRALPSGR
jgi:hypothetical protein